MSKNETPEERITAWLLATAPTQAPNQLLEQTLEQTHAIRRRGLRLGWRAFSMMRSMAIVTAAAVVVVALVLVGGVLLDRSPGVGGPPASTAPSAMPSGPFPSSSAASADPDAATATGQVAYHATVDGNTDIFLANGDGTGVTRLTMDPGADMYPSWSPDGASIAFIRDGDVHVMAADGSDAKRLTSTSEAEMSPTFSPDGTAVIFGRPFAAEEYAIHQVDLDGSNERSLYRAPWHIEGNAHLISADVLLVVRDAIGVGEVTRVDLGTGVATPLTEHRDGDAWVFAPSFDGSRIAYVNSDGPEPGLYVVDLDGTDSRHVTSATDAAIDWNAEGSAIAWTADDSTLSFAIGGWISLVRPDGTGLTRVLQGDSPAWRPGH